MTTIANRTIGLVLASLAIAAAASLAPSTARAQARSYDLMFSDPEFLAQEQGMTDSEKAGRRIWLFATAGNSRFHTYVMQQRLGILVDWYRVMNTDRRAERFSTWGVINDPGCCVPGSDNCPATSKEETFGFDWCPGDAELLAAVGTSGYRDPACDLVDAPRAADDPHGAAARQSACALEMGTSTGVLGLRKFPNPKFDRARWQALNGSLGTWQGFQGKLDDASVEPPFLIGMSCGACHIAFNPLNPPADPANPRWSNVDGLIGNQYSRFSELLASGMPTTGLEWQIFAHARPGTVDTSAVPNDGVNNPGTINAIINLLKRPTHEHDVVKWRAVNTCAVDDETQCWCEPGVPGKCWQHGRQTERVHNILKGGEDSIGALEAIQRVYVNIGSCSEQSWVNHLIDLRQTDPEQRLYRQTPFDIGQARRDCANFRAIEDRLRDLANFLFTARPSDLYAARGLQDNAALVAQLESRDGFGEGAVERGRGLFAANCARCHASRNSRNALLPAAVELEPFETRDYRLVDPSKPDLRLDWLGNDELSSVEPVATYHSRALHSNHMTGHVWQEYGSETLRAKLVVDALPERTQYKDGGRGYYRNISLLSVWASAPFMHNNAIGPELCGPTPPSDPSWETDSRRNLYRSPYVATAENGGVALDVNGNPLSHPNPPRCWPYDASVEGRFALFRASMQELLNPSARLPKITRLAEEVVIPVGPRYVFREGLETGLDVRMPAGMAAARLANLRYKELIEDLVVFATNPDGLDAALAVRWQRPDERAAVAAVVRDLASDLAARPDNALEILGAHSADIQRFYSNSLALVENEGHRFGEDLSAAEKNDLTAFLATL